MEANGTASTGCNMQCYNRLAGKNRQKVEAGVIFIKFLCNYTLDCGLKKNAAIENQSLTVKCEVNFEKHFIFRLFSAAKQSSSHHHLLPILDIHSLREHRGHGDTATGEVEEMWPGGLPFERCSGRG